MYNYSHDFRSVVKCATMKVKIAIENDQSFKTLPNILTHLISSHCKHKTDKEQGLPSLQVGGREDRVERGGSGREKKEN